MDPKEAQKRIEQLHEKACQQNQDTYIDPISGYSVFTRVHHLKRGACCKSGCRHCPWSFKKGAPDKKSENWK